MVLDTSAALELLLDTIPGREVAKRLEDESAVIHVPHLIDVEIAQVLRRYSVRRVFSAERAALALNHWRDLDIERHPHEPFLGRVWQLRNNFSAYDAVYVALAEVLSTTLITADQKLARAPGSNATVELI